MSRKKFFAFIKPLLYQMLNYEDTVVLADTIRPKSGWDAFDHVTNLVKPQIDISGLENLPKDGKCIIISNHPTGLADGMAVFKAIKDKRPDHIFLANADALRVIPDGEDIIIPVEWVLAKRTISKTRETLSKTRKALSDERCVVIFPSGKLALLTLKGLKDHAWESSAAMLARKYGAPIIPLRIKARNSWLYYLYAKINNELRDITLFKEVLNKRGQKFEMVFGAPIQPADIAKNADAATSHIRQIVEKL
ncbi:MAG: acyltransferase [Hellea sp.]|nr:acyltransferase [Hellea sp.]